MSSHMSECEGCRRYFAELAGLHRSHVAAAGDLSAAEGTPRLYRKVAVGIRSSSSFSASAALRNLWLWRVPIIASMVVVVASLPALRQPQKPSADLAGTVSQPQVIDMPETSLLNYSRALAQSPEALDALLARAANGVSTSAEVSQTLLLKSLKSEL